MLGLLFVLFVSLSSFLDAEGLAGSRPNVILVITDDQGMGDLSCMGNEIVRTPNIDRFYAGATRFADFQVSPTCAPTRAAMMSGRFAFNVGVTHTIFQRERMSPNVYTFPQLLQSAGYATGLFGKWHLGDEPEYLPQARGFDEVLMHGAGGIGQTKYGDFPANDKKVYFDNVLLHNDTVVQTRGFCTDVFFNAAMSWIYEQKATEAPYFAYISLNAPHGPMIAPDAYKQRFLDAGYQEYIAARYGMVENIDDNFGAMMAQLESWGALENTIVIFMTDNGMSSKAIQLNGETFRPHNAGMRGGKNSTWEGGTHVPCFWQWKGVLDAGVDIDGLAAHIDLLPTFAELAGVELPEDLQALDGRSVVPLLEDADADWADRTLFFNSGRWKAGHREAHKYIKCAVRTQKWRFVNNDQLYNIQEDPGERENLYAEYPEVVERLRKAYDNWWASALPNMINEGLPLVAPEDQPFAQLEAAARKEGIPLWEPAIVLEL